MTADTTLSKATSIVLEFSAAWYLATYLTLKGSISAGPILISSLIALIIWLFTKDKHGFKPLSKNEQLWAILLFGFGAWSIFTIWLDNGTSNLYEVPAKFILGSLIAIPLMAKGINFNWIKAGVICGNLSLIYLIISSYDSLERFSPIMNATKWGNAVAFQTLLTICIAVIEKSIAQKILLLILGVVGIYATLITGTRGAIIPFLTAPLALIFVYKMTLSKKNLAISVVMSTLLIASTSQLSIVKNRIDSTFSDFEKIQNDNYNNSIGQRLTMWNAGIQATFRSPIIGYGYDYNKVFFDYTAPTPGLEKSAAIVRKSYRLFHSAYIDTLVKTGFIGFFLFVSLLVTGFWNRNKHIMLICIAPTIGFAAAGLTDSALALGITSTYLIVAGTLLKATKLDG